MSKRMMTEHKMIARLFENLQSRQCASRRQHTASKGRRGTAAKGPPRCKIIVRD